MSTIDPMQEASMARTRYRNAEIPERMQRAIALFPLQVANMAHDLNRLIEHRDIYGRTSNVAYAIEYLTDRIKQCYRESFGCEMGGNPAELVDIYERAWSEAVGWNLTPMYENQHQGLDSNQRPPTVE